jgi:hypothetical protein
MRKPYRSLIPPLPHNIVDETVGRICFMTTSTPAVPPTDFVTPLLFDLPQQVFKQFTSSPQMVFTGLLILGMLIVGSYLKARKNRKKQEAAAAKRSRPSGSRRSASTTRRVQKDKDTGGTPVEATPRPAAATTGLVHKVMWSPAGNLTLVSEDGILSGVSRGQGNYRTLETSVPWR